MVHDLNRQWNEQLSESEVQRHANIADAAMRAEQHYQSPTKPWSNWTPIIVSRVLRDTKGGFPMAEDFNRQWNEQQSLSEAQRHANMAESAKRGEQHYQGSSKPTSKLWDRLYSVARIVIPAIGIVGLLAMVGFAVWVVASSG